MTINYQFVVFSNPTSHISILQVQSLVVPVLVGMDSAVLFIISNFAKIELIFLKLESESTVFVQWCEQ